MYHQPPRRSTMVAFRREGLLRIPAGGRRHRAILQILYVRSSRTCGVAKSRRVVGAPASGGPTVSQPPCRCKWPPRARHHDCSDTATSSFISSESIARVARGLNGESRRSGPAARASRAPIDECVTPFRREQKARPPGLRSACRGPLSARRRRSRHRDAGRPGRACWPSYRRGSGSPSRARRSRAAGRRRSRRRNRAPR